MECEACIIPASAYPGRPAGQPNLIYELMGGPLDGEQCSGDKPWAFISVLRDGKRLGTYYPLTTMPRAYWDNRRL